MPASVVQALAAQGITEPTAVQAAVIPDALSGADVLGRAQTGSGKTLAFGLPVLARLSGARSRSCHPRALIVVPTRELANQVARSLQPLAEATRLKLTTVYGGIPYEKQTRQLRQRADVVVATPGRLEDLYEHGFVSFDDVQVTVLDEADHLCDLGFYPAVDKLVGRTPAGSQRMLLSATLDGDVDALVRTHLRNPKMHELDPSAGAVSTMTHHTLIVGGYREKIRATSDLIEANGRTIVFTRTRESAEEIAQALTDDGVPAVDLHGNLSQRVRERNLERFTAGKARAVVATDVAARGIHVDAVDLVVHFDAASDAKAYLHRSGRTARAGRSGAVVTISTPKAMGALTRLQQQAGVQVRHHDFRTAPTPLTAAALAESGSEGPSRPAGRERPRTARAFSDRARTDRPRVDRPRADRLRSDRPRTEGSRADRPRTDGTRADRSRADRPHTDRLRSDRPRTDGLRTDDRPRTDRTRTDRTRTDRPRTEWGNDRSFGDRSGRDQAFGGSRGERSEHGTSSWQERPARRNDRSGYRSNEMAHRDETSPRVEASYGNREARREEGFGSSDRGGRREGRPAQRGFRAASTETRPASRDSSSRDDRPAGRESGREWTPERRQGTSPRRTGAKARWKKSSR